MNAWVFDKPHAVRFTEARQAFLQNLLPNMGPALNLRTALDLGCGVGHFSSFLHRMGFQVTGVDGRPENVEEARKRCSDARFAVANVEDRELSNLGMFDFVLCFGLLYHLENPFRALRNLHAVTTKLALIESICVPDPHPALHLRQETETEDQGLNFVAFYPSESCLVSLLYRAGFESVYGLARLPDHEDFCSTSRLKRLRTMLVASRVQLRSDLFFRIPETVIPFRPWETGWGRAWHQAERLWRFASKPWSDKVATTRRYLGRVGSESTARGAEADGPDYLIRK
jgi:tRNA (mo5U34)-methyltransferase